MHYTCLNVVQAAAPKPRIQPEPSDFVAARRNLVGLRLSLRKAASEFCDDAAAHLEPVLAECDRDIQRLEEKTQALIAGDEVIAPVPGCGPLTAADLCADLPELGSVSARQAATLGGVAPYDCESGVSKGRRLIRGGRRHPCNLLYMDAISAIRWNPH